MRFEWNKLIFLSRAAIFLYDHVFFTEMKKLLWILLCFLLISCTPKTVTCEGKAEALIPEKISLLQDEGRWIFSQTNKLMNNTWKDGSLLLATETAYLKQEGSTFRIRDDDKFAIYESATLNFNATFTFQKIQNMNRTVRGYHPDNIHYSLFELNDFSIVDSSIISCAEH